jgi:hypothetical protein
MTTSGPAAGLETIAYFANHIVGVLSVPPIDHAVDGPVSPNPVIIFENGVLETAVWRKGIVRVTIAAESGAIQIADLTPSDAITLGRVLTGSNGA